MLKFPPGSSRTHLPRICVEQSKGEKCSAGKLLRTTHREITARNILYPFKRNPSISTHTNNAALIHRSRQFSLTILPTTALKSEISSTSDAL
jgi:hypothetical protein